MTSVSWFLRICEILGGNPMTSESYPRNDGDLTYGHGRVSIPGLVGVRVQIATVPARVGLAFCTPCVLLPEV
jgi:hypothetical protein